MNAVDESVAVNNLDYYRHAIEFTAGVTFYEPSLVKLLQNGDEKLQQGFLLSTVQTVQLIF